MKRRSTYPQHPAVLNVQSTTRARYAIPVMARTSDGYRHVEVKLPWGPIVKGIDERDLLTPAGAPFSFSVLTDEAYAIRDKRDKAERRRRKGRRS